MDAVAVQRAAEGTCYWIMRRQVNRIVNDEHRDLDTLRVEVTSSIHLLAVYMSSVAEPLLLLLRVSICWGLSICDRTAYGAELYLSFN